MNTIRNYGGSRLTDLSDILKKASSLNVVAEYSSPRALRTNRNAKVFELDIPAKNEYKVIFIDSVDLGNPVLIYSGVNSNIYDGFSMYKRTEEVYFSTDNTNKICCSKGGVKLYSDVDFSKDTYRCSGGSYSTPVREGSCSINKVIIYG